MRKFHAMRCMPRRSNRHGQIDRQVLAHIRAAWICAALLLLVAGRSSAADSYHASVEGRWLTDDRKAVVTIGHCGEALCGNISKVLDTAPGVPRTDINNRDARLRIRPIVGLPVLTGFRREGNQWTGGRAYDPKTGNSYRSTLELNDDGSLKVTGCVLFICQSKRWIRQS